MAGIVPKEIAEIEFKLGDQNENGKVDVNVRIAVGGNILINKTIDIDLATGFRLLRPVMDFAGSIKGLIGK